MFIFFDFFFYCWLYIDKEQNNWFFNLLGIFMVLRNFFFFQLIDYFFFYMVYGIEMNFFFDIYKILKDSYFSQNLKE